MSTEPPEPVPDQNSRQERVWLSAGAVIGVIVAGLVIAVVVLTGNPDGDASSGAPPSAGSSSVNPGAAVAAARDASLRAAEEDVIVLNTLDYRNTAENLNRWESVASTPLLDELRSKRTDTANAAEKNKTTTTAKLLFAAVAKLSPDNSQAEVLASVELTITDPKGPPTVKQVRQKITMIHIGDGWKASGFTNVESPS